MNAQTDDELLENFFRDNEAASESDAQQFLENLELLRDRPLNLNTVTRDELLALKLLNPIQVENFITYRTRFGPFLNEYELQAIPRWGVADIRRILQFARVKSGLDNRNTNLLEGFRHGDNEVFLRWARPDPPNYNTRTAQGKPNAWAMRYRHNFDNRLRFGVTMETDAGENFFANNRIPVRNENGVATDTISKFQGFDFYSAHLFVQNFNQTVRVVALGDYAARMGQGLLLQTGFAPGKSAETVSVARGGRKLNAYGAFGEAFFFRGAATTLAFGKNLEVTAMYSHRRRDANIQEADSLEFDSPEIEFSSLQTSGLHRTMSELEDKRKLREQVGGISASWIAKRGQITANALHIAYDKPWNPAPAPYRQFVFRGRSLTGTSIDYNYRWRNLFLFGESARSDNGGFAAVNGLLFSADRHVTLTAVHRSLGKDYQSIYGNPFAEVSGASNERGLYMGADIRWVRRWQINLYADVWRHPWLRFGVDAPSNGREFLARVLWTKSRNFSVYALWQSETKQRNGDIENTFSLVEGRRDRLRLHSIYKVSKPIELRSRMEWTTYTLGENQPSLGFVAYQEAIIKPLGSPFSAAIRYAIFDTKDFDSRVYAFENDLFAAVSIPAFSGRGTRWYANLHWRVNHWLRLDARIEQTNTLRAVSSTGATGKEWVWKVQTRMKF
ncbi:MAG: helix-hairpin-helix domain-containing protein [Saprospiraceae bacterium]|nr:helix-hairpin-helix domain-containing protein [Saprospiraceae bacterium]